MGAAGGDGAGPDRPADILQLVDIAPGAVDDHAADAAVPGEAAHQAAADRGLGVAAGIDHDDVAGLAHLQGFQRVDQVALGELQVSAWPTALALKGGLIAELITPVRYMTSAKTQEAE